MQQAMKTKSSKDRAKQVPVYWYAVYSTVAAITTTGNCNVYMHRLNNNKFILIYYRLKPMFTSWLTKKCAHIDIDKSIEHPQTTNKSSFSAHIGLHVLTAFKWETKSVYSCYADQQFRNSCNEDI